MHSNIFILHVSLIYTLEENSTLITWDKAEEWVRIDLQNNSTSQSWVRSWLHETGMNSGQYNKVYMRLLWKYEAITWDQYKLRSVGFLDRHVKSWHETSLNSIHVYVKISWWDQDAFISIGEKWDGFEIDGGMQDLNNKWPFKNSRR